MDILQCKTELAVEYGIDVAIFIHNIVFWVEKNMANDTNFKEGRYWTYNSMDAYCQLYPMWSKDQIRRIIVKCKENGLLIVGEFNSDRRDRTKWYSPSDEVMQIYGVCKTANCIWRNRQMHMGKSPNACGEIATPLPDNNTTDNIPPYNPPTGELSELAKEDRTGVEEIQNTPTAEPSVRKRKRSNEPKKAPDWKPERFADFWKAYPCGKSKQAAIKAWDKLKPDEDLLHLMALGLQRDLQSDTWGRGIGIPYASTWLNNRRWEDEDKPLPVKPEAKASRDQTEQVQTCIVEEEGTYEL